MCAKLLLLLVLALPTLTHAATPTALTTDDIAGLLKPPVHGARIIALWSLDCAYCESHLQALAKLQQAHPRQIELVTVATDSIQQQAAIEARLKAANMLTWPARAYADDTPERINYLLDPQWGGETPRTLIIHADGRRQHFSGALTPAQLHIIEAL
ncbi:hypothetical protein [Dyella tabacisoli]|uniref:Thioredoxin domain-containing protein n=1 Tax=Dyella tabacisoli TaxID=2282381 RepID=A0A369UP91_9GAMM|nr:hypothetical protein [Dyella tabacisoli]RDD82466.1 hypothetical protein DVJ77_05840 [Dyella tabacisoli]